MLTRRQFFASSAAVAAPAILRGARRTPGDKPNLLFILPDQWRADTLGVYGNSHVRVPVLNRLASESIVFDRAYVSQPVCTPARATLLTGLYPRTNGLITNGPILKPEIPCFPELLNDPAYRTAYMGKWHLGDEQFPQHGFQEWVSIEDYTNWTPGRDRTTRSSYHHFLIKQGYKPDQKNGTFHRGYTSLLPLEHSKATFLADEASRFILKNRDTPWILYYAPLEPHAPINSVLNDLHDPAETPLPPNYPGIPAEDEPESYIAKRSDNSLRHYDQLFHLPGHGLKNRADFERLVRSYAGMCSQVDQAIGRILWSLEASGAAENTIIVFTSDHGEMMGSHSLFGKEVLYEEAVRVPFFIRAPHRQSRFQRFDQPVSHIDVVPTLLDLMGAKPRAGLEGESLLPALKGGRRKEDHVFVEWNEPPDGPNARGVISPDGWKLGIYDKGKSILFNRIEDPLEMHNLFYKKEYADVIRRLRKKLGV